MVLTLPLSRVGFPVFTNLLGQVVKNMSRRNDISLLQRLVGSLFIGSTYYLSLKSSNRGIESLSLSLGMGSWALCLSIFKLSRIWSGLILQTSHHDSCSPHITMKVDKFDPDVFR